MRPSLPTIVSAVLRCNAFQFSYRRGSWRRPQRQAQVVVIANGSPITELDIAQRCKLLTESTHKTPSRQQVIDELINDRVKISKAKSYGFELPEKDVEDAYNSMASRQHLTTQQFDQLLQRAGASPAALKARLGGIDME